MLKVMGEGEPDVFLNHKLDSFTLLHQAIKDKNEPVLEIISKELPYFRDIINNDDNDKDVTPLNLAV